MYCDSRLSRWSISLPVAIVHVQRLIPVLLLDRVAHVKLTQRSRHAVGCLRLHARVVERLVCLLSPVVEGSFEVAHEEFP
eukprot:CAMPEP_0185194646 /NCGR_PEP_ID=MMETSP1140-20130426/31641_1 /TAXON_ID=298111 /ORGANISM="Pavlova sp., Strain CCMP459" /LENGTH=79 /DNA_ID=CAMNT_0027761583 /DNA_START=206 /DNA_END=445 /DNA_ORIENTATION=+